MSEQKRDWRLFGRLVPYIRGHVGLGVLSLTLMVLVDVAGVLKPWLVKVGIDDHVRTGDLDGLFQVGVWLFAALAAGFIAQVLYTVVVQYLGQKLLYDLRLDLYRKVLRLSRDYFDRTPLGKTLTNVTNDVEAIREFISEGIVTVAGDMLKIVFILGAMFLLHVKLALMALLTLPVFIGATAIFRRTIRSGFAGVRKANGEINTALSETISGSREIHLFQVKTEARNRFEQCNRGYLSAYLQVVRAYAFYFPVLELVSNGGMVVMLLYAHYAMGIELEPGIVFAFFAYLNMFFFPLRQMAEKFNLFQSAMAAAERAFRLLDEPVSVENPKKPVAPASAAPMAIEFDSVTFGYDPDNPVLKNVSFRIEPGQTVALLGRTGSGKTTVIKLVNRLYDIQQGRILLDGVDVRDLDVIPLRERIGTIPQDPFLFTGTIADNISLHRPGIDRARVLAAAAATRAADFINRLPLQYDEPILEEGKRLSVGQRQLLSFTRALVSEPDLMILDEATASIDSETEKLIENAVESLIEGRTAIIIAHRLSTIRCADRILMFHKGELVEDGTHDELLKADGLYKKFYDTQAFLLDSKVRSGTE